jgi:hypothetical protein
VSVAQGWIRLKDKVRLQWFRYCAGYRSQPGTRQRPRSTPIIVSLTTIKERLPYVHIVIETLLQQSILPDRIVLWMDENLRLPPENAAILEQQVARGLEIRRCRDVGPHTKYYFALQSFPPHTLVLADDDIVFPSSWLGELLEAHRAAPKVIQTHRAHEILFEPDGQPKPYTQWNWHAKGIESSPRLVATSGFGTLFPAGSLHRDVCDVATAQSLAPRADDLWLKAMSLKAGSRIAKVRPEPFHHFFIPGTQVVRLWDDNGMRGGNDRQFRAIMDHYQLWHHLHEQ